MSGSPRGHTPKGRAEASTPSALPRLRSAADLDAVVREFAGRVARLERELADLRALVGGLSDAPRAGAEVPQMRSAR